MTLPTKYKGKKHCDQLIEMFGKGKDVAHFCFENKIPRSTFHNWIDANKEFAQAYSLAKEGAEAWLLDQGLSGTVHPSIWARLIAVRCKYPMDRTIPIKGFRVDKSTYQKAEAVHKMLKNGEVTSHEAASLLHGLKTTADIEEKTDLAKQVAELQALVKK